MDARIRRRTLYIVETLWLVPTIVTVSASPFDKGCGGFELKVYINNKVKVHQTVYSCGELNELWDWRLTMNHLN